MGLPCNACQDSLDFRVFNSLGLYPWTSSLPVGIVERCLYLLFQGLPLIPLSIWERERNFLACSTYSVPVSHWLVIKWPTRYKYKEIKSLYGQSHFCCRVVRSASLNSLYLQNYQWDSPKVVPPWISARKLGDLHVTTRTDRRTIQMDRSIDSPQVTEWKCSLNESRLKNHEVVWSRPLPLRWVICYRMSRYKIPKTDNEMHVWQSPRALTHVH